MTQAATYILVHGAWHGAWCWRDVGEELNRRDVPWVALDLPSSTLGAPDATYLADDARAVLEVARLEGPVVLVGHSYGGAVITEAADRVEHLVGLIYIAALVPHLGQSATEASREIRTRTLLDEAIELDGGHLFLRPDLVTEALYHDCPDDVAAWATAQLSTQTVASFRSPRVAADVDAPSCYVRCTNDRAIDPSLQLVMAERCDEMVNLASGHSPFLSRPVELCDLVLR